MKDLAGREKMIMRPLYRKLRDYAAELGYKDLIYLNIGEPDFPTPRKIIEAAEKAMKEGFTHYTEEKGMSELRKALAVRMKKEKGIDVDPDGILITNGGAEAVFTAILSFVNPGEEVILLEPYYPPYASAVYMADGKAVSAPVDRETLMPNIELIESKITDKTKLMVVNSPCNPTGMVYDEKLLRDLAEIAESRDIYVISDEVYEKFFYNEKKYYSIASLPEMFKRTIIINSFSKTYAMTGWRVGYLAGEKEIVAKMLKIKSAINVCASSISQRAALAALEEALPDVDEMLAEYAARRKYLLEALSKIEGFRCPIPHGAFYMFPNISAVEKDSLKFAMHILKDAHVVVSPGVAFGLSGEGHIRISYASSIDELRDAVNRIRKSVGNY